MLCTWNTRLRRRKPLRKAGVGWRLLLVAALGAVGVATALGELGIAGVASGKSRIAGHAPREVSTNRSPIRIIGGSAAQRRLLREVLVSFDLTRIRQLRVVRVHGGVSLQAPAEAMLTEWEGAVVGVVFSDRSAEQHLSRVLEVDVGPVVWFTDDASPRPPRATSASVADTRRAMRRLALASGAGVLELQVSRPDGLAVALRVRVRNAAKFLEHRLRALVLGAEVHEGRYEGLYIEVDDARGMAWGSAETRLGGDSYVRPSLIGCDPFPPPYQSGVVVGPCPG
jgi:hypothetical protein